MKAEKKKLSPFASQTGYGLLGSDGLLSSTSDSLNTMTAPWKNTDAWWVIVRRKIPPFPMTLCHICDCGQQLGSAEITIPHPEQPSELPPFVFQIEFAGHPHSVSATGRETMILVRHITKEKMWIDSIYRDIHQYESICHFIEDVYYRMDLAGNLIFISPTCHKLLNYQPEELEGKPFSRICIAPEHMAELLAILENSATIADFDMVFRCPKGLQIPVSMSAHVVRDDKGNKIAIEGILRDVTERTQMDVLLMEKTRQFQEIIDQLQLRARAMDEHNLVMITDPDGVITYVSDRVTQVTLYAATELIGKTPRAFDSGCNTQSFFHEMRQVVSSGQIWRGEICNKNKSGQLFWLDCSIVPFLTQAGRPFQYVVLGTDVSARVNTNARLQTNRDFLAQVIDAMAEGFYVLDAKGCLISLNQEAEKLLGWREEELLHKNLHEMIHYKRPDNTRVPGEACAVHQSLLGRAIRRDDDYFIKKDGTFLPVSHVSTPLRQNNKIIGSVCVFRDHTQTRQAQTYLEQHRNAAMESSRMKSVFLANMSHEIRTPMNAIVGMNDLLLGTNLSAEQHEFASIVRESAQSLLSLINDILDFSKIEAGKIDIEEIDFSPITVVERSVELLAGQAHQKGLALATFISPKIPTNLKGDPGRLRQMLLNLTSNAIKFTEKGEVVVRAQIESDSPERVVVRFSVTDTGIGLSKQRRGRLFEPFIQADGDTTRKYGGTGLGLAISKRLTDLMSGSIGIESEEGKGSTFWIRIPFKLSDPTAMGKYGNLNLGPLRGVSALVIMENASDLEILSEYFTAWGMKCRGCSNWPEGLDAIRQEIDRETPFKFIILAAKLSAIDTLILPTFLEKNRLLGPSRLMVVQNVEDKDLRQTYRQAGFAVCWVKPIQQSSLVNELVDLLQPYATKSRVITIAEATSERLSPEKERETDVHGVLEPGKLILLAEDNRVNQKVTLLQLKKLGYTAHAVANGQEAVDAFSRLLYALILMDCQMPVMDGFEATRAIRKMDRAISNPNHIPIIAMTANAMKGDRERCLDTGMDDYMSKPVSPETLKEKLRFWMPKGSRELPPIEISQLRQLFGDDDPTIRDMLHRFLPSAQDLVSRLRDASRSKSIGSLTDSAIELQDASVNMGASGIAQLARMAESAAQTSDWAKVWETINRLERSVRNVETFVKNF